MKLKEFNAENTISVRGGFPNKPVVGLNTKSGLFNFSPTAVAILQLKAGDQIVCHQEEEQPDTWYLEKVTANGFVLREKANITKGLIFNNTALARAIAGSVDMGSQGGKVIISGEPLKLGKRTLWIVITASLKKAHKWEE